MPPPPLPQGRGSRPASRSPTPGSGISDDEELEALNFTRDSLAALEQRRRLPRLCGLPSLALAALALVCAAVLLFFAAHKRPTLPPAPRPPPGLPPPFRHFITVNGTAFTDGCRTLIVVGVNIENLVEAAILEVSEAARGGDPERPSGRALAAALLGAAGAAGANVVRTWAHTTDPAHPLQRHAGEYDPAALDALDWTVAAAAAAGLRLQLSFVDTWRYHGGVQEFVDWSPTAAPRDPRWPPIISFGDVAPGGADAAAREAYAARRRAAFFEDPGARALFKSHMSTLLTRKNPYQGGLSYAADPTIFSFGLINEPRCDAVLVPACPRLLQAWVEEMAAHFRALDRNHLLTLGEEGFYGGGDPSEGANPGTWGAATGQDFVTNHRAPGISYAAIHAWPDNWSSGDGAAEFLQRWMRTHAGDAAARLGMPLVLEEVGRKVDPAPGTPHQLQELRDPVLRTVFAEVEAGLAGLATGAGLQGSMLWQLDLRLHDASPYSPYGIRVNDTAFELLREHAGRVAAALGTAVCA